MRVYILDQISSEIPKKSFDNPQWIPSTQGQLTFRSMLEILNQHKYASEEIQRKSDQFGTPPPKSLIEFNEIWGDACEFLMSEISLSFVPEYRIKVFDYWKFSKPAFDKIETAVNDIRKMNSILDEIGSIVGVPRSNSIETNRWISDAKQIPSYASAML